MKHVLGQWWMSRSPQERWVIAAASLCLGLALYAWMLQATTHARQRLLPAVAELRAAAIRQGEQADEIMRLRATPAPPPSTTDLRQLVQRQVDASGLTGSLVSVELVDAHQVKVVFGSVAFAAWLTWADTMQAQHLRFAAVRLEAQPAPGQVSVTATLDRPGP
ncbi:MAG TPA: type II secretion system protein GspM [Rhodanobacter sp.]|jgi:type II secretory pathway component PulM